MDLKFIEAEVHKLNLGPNDTLIVKLKGEEFDQSTLSSLQDHFKEAFKGNPVRVLLFALPENHEMKFEVVTKEKTCNTESYCSNCSCGKKESYENSIKSSEETEEATSTLPDETI